MRACIFLLLAACGPAVSAPDAAVDMAQPHDMAVADLAPPVIDMLPSQCVQLGHPCIGLAGASECCDFSSSAPDGWFADSWCSALRTGYHGVCCAFYGIASPDGGFEYSSTCN